MGALIAALVLAPVVAAAGVLDWRTRRRRHLHARPIDHRGKAREIETGLDLGDLES
jgi:hypothetical protein